MNRTFYGCKSLVDSPLIPNTVTNINGTYDGCVRLKNPSIIPDGVTEMFYTFRNCYSLMVSTPIPNGVKEMCGTFEGCVSLVERPIIPEDACIIDVLKGCVLINGNKDYIYKLMANINKDVGDFDIGDER